MDLAEDNDLVCIGIQISFPMALNKVELVDRCESHHVHLRPVSSDFDVHNAKHGSY